jgi:hypothetical protein
MPAKRHRGQIGECRLCKGLPQVSVHFDSDYWEDIRKAAEERLAEVRAEIAEADRHIRMLTTPAP